MLRNWKFWLGVLISAFFLLYALKGQRLPEVWLAIQQANYWWLIPSVTTYFLAVAARTWRWHFLLRPIKRIPLTNLFPVVVIGYMGNNVYPLRAGEFMRAYVLKKKEGVSVSASLATIVVERLFDGLTMLFFVFVTLPFVEFPAVLRQVVILGSLFFFGALAAFLVIVSSPDRSKAIYGWLVERFLPQAVGEKARGYLDRFMLGLHSLRSGRHVTMVFVTSVAIWLTETVKYWFVMHGFPFYQPFHVLMLMAAVVNLATTIPSSPGYVGTFDAPGIEILKTFKVPGDLATSYTLVLHAALWFPVTVLGFFYMWQESLSWGEIGVAAQARELGAERV
ncbi:MAG: lysylphosphatidylglycerol synthase transmembrane domain-containing protein [Anaerolineae bacterium]